MMVVVLASALSFVQVFIALCGLLAATTMMTTAALWLRPLPLAAWLRPRFKQLLVIMDRRHGSRSPRDAARGGASSAADSAPPAPGPAPTTLRALLPARSQQRWRRGGLADRPMDFSQILEDAQLMAAQAAALRALNELAREMGEQSHDRLWSAIGWAEEAGVLNRGEVLDLRSLNRDANAAKHRL